ncbi:MAG: hypothetical protein A2297_02590 [Elusimicrobia bacterium RIFOXYB2_FULL_48_7]|nr:MAG: hypothetical protein A2297_02590 [Elusimicrobia bacterium RIFOXYB2_FULL_48_7]
MVKIAYFNCPSGIAGDMMLSSLLECGVSPVWLETYLKKALKIKNWKLAVKKAHKGHTSATHIDVVSDFHFDTPAQMKSVLAKSSLPSGVKAKSLDVMNVLISAESKIHKMPANKVHFHELSSIDTLIDITGNILVLEKLGIEKVFASNINIGKAEPATLEIIKRNKIPVYVSTPQYELTTPTAAALMAVLVESFSLRPVFNIEKFGFGAGTFDVPGHSNMVTVMIGSMQTAAMSDTVILLETNIDDMDPRVYPFLSELLFKAGALDVWLTNIIMKKGRPAVKVSVLCSPETENALSNIILRETTTIGIRSQSMGRTCLPRIQKGENKISTLPDGSTKSSVEYRKAVIKALKTKTPLYRLLIPKPTPKKPLTY